MREVSKQPESYAVHEINDVIAAVLVTSVFAVLLFVYRTEVWDLVTKFRTPKSGLWIAALPLVFVAGIAMLRKTPSMIRVQGSRITYFEPWWHLQWSLPLSDLQEVKRRGRWAWRGPAGFLVFRNGQMVRVAQYARNARRLLSDAERAIEHNRSVSRT
jgi:hypothetical protein